MLLFNSKRIAVFSIIFLATDFTFNLTGHFARHWNTSSLFIWISMFYAFKLLYSNSYKIYFHASLSSGIGFGVSYIFGGFSFIFFTIFHFLKYKIKYLKNLIFSIFIFITLGLISIFIHPYPLLRLIEDKPNNVTALYVDNSFLSTIFYYLESMFFKSYFNIINNNFINILFL